MTNRELIGRPYRKALVTRATWWSRSNHFSVLTPEGSEVVPGHSEAWEFAETTELYARLANELATFRKSASYAEYESKLLEVDAARERCDKARRALTALRIERRKQNSIR